MTLGNWTLEFSRDALWCLGSPDVSWSLPSIPAILSYSHTPARGRAGVLPQAGTDKCSPEMSASLIFVGQSGPVPLPHVAATYLNSETQRAGDLASAEI